LNQEDFTECSDQKEENVDGQDNIDKCKEIKTEEHEKEISIKKEIKEVLHIDILDILIKLGLDLLLRHLFDFFCLET